MMIRTKALGLIALGTIWFSAVPASAQQCVGDANGDNEVTIDELVTAVGNALDGCGFASGLVSVSGRVAGTGSGTFRVWASGDSGVFRASETALGSGRFTLLLPPGDWYVLGFGHYHGHGEMHFAGHMAFPCGTTESDHFFVSGHEHAVDLGPVTLSDDGSFALPERNPLEQLDRDGDGIPDAADPDALCDDIGDADHDGFYDDDMDHDGYHDDDVDHDDHHDCNGMMDHHGCRP